MDRSRLLQVRTFFTVSCFCFLLPIFCYGATDTLITGQSINQTQTITSSTGNYQLGFSIPSWHNNNLTYIIIWCKNLKQDPVWVANRENPITDSSTAVLKIGNDGNLIIVDATGTIIWSTNLTTPPNETNETTEAVLSDSGNLILRYRDGVILWQSFDYPTDTLLPGMKLGINLKTGRKWSLSSGEMELGLDLQGEIFARKNGVPQWRGGYWNGKSFNGLPEMTRSKNSYDYSFTRKENEFYFSYESSVLSGLVLHESGKLEHFALMEIGESRSWNLSWSRARNRCGDYTVCGAFAVSSCEADAWTVSCRCLQGWEGQVPSDGSGGRCREKVLECGKQFVPLVRMKLPDRAVQSRAGDCEAECRSNCSCVGYAVVNSECLVWSGDLMDLQQFDGEGEGEVFYLRFSDSEQGGAKNRLLVIVIATAILGLVSLVSGTFFFWRRAIKRGIRKRSRELMLQDLGVAVTTRKNSSVTNKNEDGWENAPELLPLFNLHTIAAATKNFCIANKLGEGGFGPVYKGRLPKGEEIAVKRLSRRSTQGLEEFKNEVALIAKLQHKNLVRLLGYCIQEEEKMLIYEYMPNKSLDLFLFDPANRLVLDWGRSFDIIEGIAQGLLYLHRYSRLRIIHRDLKASNILLDGDMIPKISDFGLARIFEGNQNQANTERVVGSFGYMSPEYALEGIFSEKSDVFSFGVLLLEIISGKRNTGVYHFEQPMNLIGYAWSMWKEGRGLELLDPTLRDLCPTNEVLKCIHIGLLCVQEDPEDRPMMSSIIFMLGGEITNSPAPKQPAFSRGKSSIQTSSCTSRSRSSTNEVISDRVEPR